MTCISYYRMIFDRIFFDFIFSNLLTNVFTALLFLHLLVLLHQILDILLNLYLFLVILNLFTLSFKFALFLVEATKSIIALGVKMPNLFIEKNDEFTVFSLFKSIMIFSGHSQQFKELYHIFLLDHFFEISTGPEVVSLVNFLD